MKKQTSFITLFLFLGLLVICLAWLGAKETYAQIDAFTFFIPYDTDGLNDQFDQAVDEENVGAVGCTDPPGGDLGIQDGSIDTTISIAVLRAGTKIYYDHWEDGLEANLTEPTQASTQVWGDGNPANGSLPAQIPPNMTGTDILTKDGEVIVLQQRVTVPRSSTNFFFDGGDKITTQGGSIAVTLAAWPECAGTLFAGAWELFPTSRWGDHYIVPVGEDLVGSRIGFGTVGLNVQAAQPNTVVEFDVNGDGVFGDPANVTLNEGQNHIIINGVQTGSQVRTVTPGQKIQVNVFTGAQNRVPNAYEARAYTMVPVKEWGNNYLTPRSSDGDYWLYNPDRVNPLDITVATSLGPPTPLTIPPNSTLRYPPTLVSPATGVYITSNDGRPFYGLVALDIDEDAFAFRQDWGYALHPADNLTTQSLVGWGPVNSNNPPGKPPGTGNESPVYVTALTTTTLFIDFNNGGPVVTRTVNALAEVAITDTVDFDMTGATLFTKDGTPFITIWGQDKDASPIAPSIDVGTTIVPIPSLAVQKTVQLIDDADNSMTPTWGDTIQFTLYAFNNSSLKLNVATISDTLSSSLQYITNTSRVRSNSIADDATGASIFPFDEGGYLIPGGLNAREAMTATFNTLILDGFTALTNTVLADSPEAPTPDSGGVIVPLLVPRYKLDKELISPADGLALRGEVITFGITITSTGNLTIAKMPLQDNFDANHLTFLGAQPFAPNITGTGVLTWHDLATTTLFGPLPPSRTIRITTTYQVKNVPPEVTGTINIASVTGAEGEDGSPLPPQDDDAPVIFPVAAYVLDKWLIDPASGQTSSGQVITFGVAITSTGQLTITKLPLRDEFVENHLTFLFAESFNPDQTASGIITWTDLALPSRFGPLPTGRSIRLTVTFLVDNIPADVSITTNTVTVDGAEGEDGIPLPPQDDGEDVTFPGPPTPTPTPNPNPPDPSPPDDNDDGSTPDPVPAPPQSSPTPPATNTSATPVIPVLLLPETGVTPPLSSVSWGLIITIIIGGVLIWRARQSDRKK